MRRISELVNEIAVSEPLSLSGCPVRLRRRNRVNVLALGDVGATMLTAFRLLGCDVISEIGICDIRTENCERLEMEINQIRYPFEAETLMPEVRIVSGDELFDCDVMVFCASRGVPPVSADSQTAGDVRMAQLEANREIVNHYAELARASCYGGLVAVVSDPVDNLCAAFLDASDLRASQVQGYGLGVMNARALYYSERSGGDLLIYKTEGRAYGPHGQDLVIANSIDPALYDDEASERLTALARNANIEIRELGFKPYIAPAVSSAAISILLTLRGEWHYGSLYMGNAESGAFMGIRNRLTDEGWEYEDADIPDALYERIKKAFINLCRLR